MNKYEFLAQLRNALSSVPQEEREAAMSYYEEFFSDAGEENEQAVIASLGSPEELARSIIDENRKETAQSPNTSADGSGFNADAFTPPPTPARQNGGWTGGQIALIVVLLIISSPIWLGLLGVLFGLILGVFGALIGIIVAFGACAVGFFVAAIASFISGVPAFGLFGIGLSLFFVGLFPLAIYPLFKLLVKLTVVCCKGIASLIRKLTGRKGVA